MASTLTTNDFVRVKGIVTYHHESGSIFLEDETGALYAEAQTNSSVQVGDNVEVSGRVYQNGFSTTLRESFYRTTGLRGSVAPTPVTGSMLRTGKYDMRLVRISGRLITQPNFRGGIQLLQVNVEDLIVALELGDVAEGGILSQLRPGSMIQAIGVCSVGTTSERRPSGIRIELRSANDIVVLRPPPWLTKERAVFGLCLALSAMIAALGWVATLRRQILKQTKLTRERLRHEAALEERYRRIIDTALEGVLLLNKTGQIMFLNRHLAEMLGYATGDLVGQPFAKFINPAFTKDAEQILSIDKARSEPGRLDLPLLHRDGSELWVIMARNSFLDENGEESGVLVMITNISERKVAEQKIQELNQILERRVAERTAKLQETVGEIEQYSYSISHDMRGPLRAMNQFSTLLLQDYGIQLPAEAQDYLRRIASAAHRMDALIQDLLQYHRMQRDELPLVTVDLDALVAEVIAEYPSFHRAEIDVAAPLGSVCGNKAALAQCLSSILGNAVKFVAPGVRPHLQISTEATGERVKVIIADNGIGIAPEHLNRIWGVFHRLHSSDAYEGTGIGLSIVKKAVERMGGSVGVESQLDKGSRFWFELRRA